MKMFDAVHDRIIGKLCQPAHLGNLVLILDGTHLIKETFGRYGLNIGIYFMERILQKLFAVVADADDGAGNDSGQRIFELIHIGRNDLLIGKLILILRNRDDRAVTVPG